MYWETSDERKIGDLIPGHFDKIVALFPGGRENIYKPWAKRKWAPENWIALANLILQDFPRAGVLLFGSNSDAIISEKIILGICSHRAINIAGKTTFSQIAPLLKKCSVLITNDTATVFIAAAVSCPVIVLYGPEWPERSRPLPAKEWYPIWSDIACRETCAAFAGKHILCANDCMQRISVEAVMQSARAVLMKTKDRSGSE